LRSGLLGARAGLPALHGFAAGDQPGPGARLREGGRAAGLSCADPHGGCAGPSPGGGRRARRELSVSTLRCEIIPVTAFEQNCSLVWDSATMRGALVDAGGEVEHLLGRVAHHGVTLEKLLVTHGHLDHASGVRDLAERLKLPIEGPHQDDLFWIEALPDHARRYGFPPARSFVPDRWLQHGDSVSLGSLQ